ncbi:hypothetical protein BH23VER1_BH23VER1_19500 [soil metagenome]
MLLRLALAGITALAGVAFLTGAAKKEKFFITFHLQGEESEGSFVRPDPMTGNQLFFSVSPELTHNQMTAFSPFPGDDDRSYGAVFLLAPAGQQRMEILKATSQGRLLRALVNGVPVDFLQVDQDAPTDSIVIWKGLTEAHFKQFEKKLKRLPPR